MNAPSHYASVLRPGLFAGQLMWVTGGGSGIGRCIAHELASLGATVVISGRTADKLERVAAEIAEDGGTAITRAFDIRDEDAGEGRRGASVVAQHGPDPRPRQQRRRAVPRAAAWRSASAASRRSSPTTSPAAS